MTHPANTPRMMPSRRFFEQQTLLNFLNLRFPCTLAIVGYDGAARVVAPFLENYRDDIRAQYRQLVSQYEGVGT